MTETDETQAPTWPFPPAASRDAWHTEMSERRTQCPFGHVTLTSGHEAVLLVGRADVEAALADSRLSHNLTAPGAPRVFPGSSFLDYPEAILNMDGPEHLRIRRIVAATFTPRRIARWLPTIEGIAGALVDDLEKNGSPADLMNTFCYGLPVRVICRLLGIPEHDLGRFQRWSQAFLLAAKMTDEERMTLVLEFAEYGTALIAQRRENPGQDLIDDLIAARDGEEKLNEQELLLLVIGLLAAGNETTSTSLGNFLVALLREDRRLWRQLQENEELLPAAVDELLRQTGVTGAGLLRQAVEDVELPSGTVRAGEAVVVHLASAQWDESVFPEPQEIRFDRDEVNQLSFGAGPHYCLGAHLAKAELRIGLKVLLNRLPGLRLEADPDELAYTEGESISSLVCLPVSW